MRLCITILLLGTAAQASAQSEPIIDMHFHAMAADAMGPGQSICSPYAEFPVRDPVEPIETYLTGFSGKPDCERQFRAPASDAELIEANAEVLERRNILALTGGTAPDVELMRA